MIQDGAAMPTPSELGDIMADPHHREAVAVLVDAPSRRSAVRVNISLPPTCWRQSTVCPTTGRGSWQKPLAKSSSTCRRPVRTDASGATWRTCSPERIGRSNCCQRTGKSKRDVHEYKDTTHGVAHYGAASPATGIVAGPGRRVPTRRPASSRRPARRYALSSVNSTRST